MLRVCFRWGEWRGKYRVCGGVRAEVRGRFRCRAMAEIRVRGSEVAFGFCKGCSDWGGFGRVTE